MEEITAASSLCPPANSAIAEIGIGSPNEQLHRKCVKVKSQDANQDDKVCVSHRKCGTFCNHSCENKDHYSHLATSPSEVMGQSASS